jgi:hypothetical protein
MPRPGPSGIATEPFLDLDRRLRDEVSPGGVERREHLLEKESRRERGDLKRRRGGDRARGVVRRERDECGLGGRGDVEERRDAADVDDVGLEHGDAARAEEAPALARAVAALAGRDGHPHRVRDAAEAREAPGRDRLLEEERVEALELSPHADRAVDAEAPVPLNEEPDSRPDRLADGGDAGERVRQLLLADGEAGGAKGVELQRAVAAGNRVRRPLREVAGRLRTEVPGVRVDPGRVADATAEERVHRRVEALPEQVPERHLDAPGRRADDRTGVPVAAASSSDR